MCKIWEIFGRSNQQLAAVENGDQAEGVRGIPSLEVHCLFHFSFRYKLEFINFDGLMIRGQEGMQALRGAQR